MNSEAIFGDDFLTQLKAELSEMLVEVLLEALVKTGNSKVGPETDFLNIKEAAQFLKKKEKTLYKYISERKLPFFRIGRNVRFSKRDLELWAQSFKVKTNIELHDEALSTLLLNTRRRE